MMRYSPLRMWLIVWGGIAANCLEGLGLALLVPMFALAGVGAASETGSYLKIMALFQQGARSLGLDLTLGMVLMTLLSVFAVQSLVAILTERLIHGTRHRFAAKLRTTLYGAIFAARWEFLAKQKTGVLMNTLTLDAMRAGGAFLNLAALVRESAAIVIYMVLALILSWEMTLAAVGIAGIGLYLFRSRVAKGQEYGSGTTLAYSVVQEEATEKLSCAKLVKGFGSEGQVSERFETVAQDLADIQIRESKNRTMVGTLYQPLTVTLLLSGIYLALTVFRIPVVDIMVLLAIFFRLTPRLSGMQVTLHEVSSLLPSLVSLDEAVRTAKEHRERDGGLPFHGLRGGIRMREVWFAYENKEPVLRGVNLDLHKGEMTAIVGVSGGGKTTVVDLLMGFIQPMQGEVLVDGIPLRDLNLNEWHSRIGYVPQDVNLFNDTVRANLIWGKPDATQEEIEAAARQAHADEFIRHLPLGYETLIGNRGVLLSGGQRQRLALARALIRRPEILILDEATSALDGESEQMIQETLNSLARKMSIVLVAHRLATVQKADRICVLEGGHIVETGSWETLRLASGRFNELRRLQALT